MKALVLGATGHIGAHVVRALLEAGYPVRAACRTPAYRFVLDGLPAVITNPSICLGEHDAHAFSGRLLLLFANRHCPFRLDHRVNLIYTGDVGRGHVLAAERGTIGERYLLAAHNVTLDAFADLVAREAGVPAPRWPLPPALDAAAALACETAAAITRTEPLYSRQARAHMRLGQRLSGAKASRELGLTITPLEEAIRRSLAWFRRHGYNGAS